MLNNLLSMSDIKTVKVTHEMIKELKLYRDIYYVLMAFNGIDGGSVLDAIAAHALINPSEHVSSIASIAVKDDASITFEGAEVKGTRVALQHAGSAKSYGYLVGSDSTVYYKEH